MQSKVIEQLQVSCILADYYLSHMRLGGCFKLIYTVTFNPAIDYVVDVPNLELGITNRTKSDDIQIGGKGINVSVILGNLGIKNVALGFLAGFTGEYIQKELQKLDVLTDFVMLKDGLTRINVKVKSMQETEINGNGPVISDTALDKLFEKLSNLEKGDVLVLAGSIPKTLPNDIYEQILTKLAGRGIHFVVDATGDLLCNVLKYKPFLIKPNNFELGEIFGIEIKTNADTIYYARELQMRGAQNVLVSLGKKGAVLVDANGKVHEQPAVNGKVLNTVGAGDSMVAGFLAGYLDTGDYSEAFKLGLACGSATAFSKSLATKQEIQQILMLGSRDITKN